MGASKAQARSARLSSSLSPLRASTRDILEDSIAITPKSDLQVVHRSRYGPFENSSDTDECRPKQIYPLIQPDVLIYDKNLFRFKFFVITLLYISRSIVESKHATHELDAKDQQFLKSLYDLTFFTCMFAFTYISGKSFITSYLTMYNTRLSDHSVTVSNRVLSRILRIFSHPSISVLKIVIYKSITKYFLFGFIILYFIQPFSYYISRGYPRWAERVTLSPINFYLDSLDRIIYRAALDATSKKISYFSQLLIYLSVIRIIYLPVAEFTKYIIECSFGEIRTLTLKSYSIKDTENTNLLSEHKDLSTSPVYENTSKSCEHYSVVLDIPESNVANRNQEYLRCPHLASKKRYMHANKRSINRKYFFNEREFSIASLVSKTAIPILVILMLYYYRLGEFSMLIFIPVALPIITFALAGHLPPDTKVQISLALTYILLFFLLIPLKNYSLIWKLCLIFLLGATDTLLSFMRTQHNNYLVKREPTNIIHPLLKSISLLVFSLTTIYLVFFSSENKLLQNLSLYLSVLKEISLLFIIITLTSYPFRSELHFVEKSYGISTIHRENQNLYTLLFFHPAVIRIVSFFFQFNKASLPLYIVILAISGISLLLTQLLYHLILLIINFSLFLKSRIMLGSRIWGSNCQTLKQNKPGGSCVDREIWGPSGSANPG
ncbi:hypothetical protein OIY81_3435 [Cryptosporidium canis]|nr:hypothetical protein OIY81_3435 [Cryptosporidium canis]